MIDKVEFHEEMLSPGKTWRHVAPLFAIMIGWAWDRGYTSDYLREDSSFVKEISDLKAGKSNTSRVVDGVFGALNEDVRLFGKEFVDGVLDGAITEDMFASEILQFLNSYYSIGLYYRDIESFFSEFDLYSLPDKWSILACFYDVLDERFALFSSSGEFPAYRTMKVSKK